MWVNIFLKDRFLFLIEAGIRAISRILIWILAGPRIGTIAYFIYQRFELIPYAAELRKTCKPDRLRVAI